MATAIVEIITSIWKIIVATILFVTIMGGIIFIRDPNNLKTQAINNDLIITTLILDKGEELIFTDSKGAPEILRNENKIYLSYLKPETNKNIQKEKYKEIRNKIKKEGNQIIIYS